MRTILNRLTPLARPALALAAAGTLSAANAWGTPAPPSPPSAAPAATQDAGHAPTQDAAHGPQSAAFERAWQGFVDAMQADVHARGGMLKAGCVPRRVRARPEVPFRGTVMLVHGYTACSQQYFELLEPLAWAGYDVLLPIMPGHGYRAKDGHDDLSGMPDVLDISAYDAFAGRLNTVMQHARGERVIGGLSVGASAVMRATSLEPALYDRQLLQSPLIEIAHVGARLLVTPVGYVPWARDIEVGWGQPCRDELSYGRWGTCDYHIAHAAATQAFSHLARREDGLPPNTFILGVEQDGAASNAHMLEYVARARAAHQQAALCFMPAGTNHSMLSPFDGPPQDRWWIPAARDITLAYLIGGTLPSVDAISASDGPAPRCHAPRHPPRAAPVPPAATAAAPMKRPGADNPTRAETPTHAEGATRTQAGPAKASSAALLRDWVKSDSRCRAKARTK